MAFSKQMITDLCDHIPDPLSNFFYNEHSRYFRDYDTLNNIVDQTLSDALGSKDTKSEVSAIKRDYVRIIKKKKMRWKQSYLKGIEEYEITNPKCPLFDVQRSVYLLSGEAVLKLYGTTDIEKITDSFTNNILDWANDDDKFLIDYPLITTKTKNQVVTSFKADMVLAMATTVITLYGGNLNSYFAKKPELLLASPIFAPTRYSSVPVKNEYDQKFPLTLVTYEQDDYVFQMNYLPDPLEKDELHKRKVFDQKDNQLLLNIINNINLDFYQSQQLVIDVGTLAKALNPKPNKVMYEDVKLRVHNMQRVLFRYYKKNNLQEPIFSYGFFDSVKTIEQDGKEYLQIVFGKTLFEEITKQRMIAVTSNSYNSLDQDLSKLLYHHFQRERVSLSAMNIFSEGDLLYKSYDYSFFQRIILFKSKKKKENIKLIIDSLHEFVDKEIAISHFDYDSHTGTFNIYYFPLSNDEKADLLSTKNDTGALPLFEFFDMLNQNTGDET